MAIRLLSGDVLTFESMDGKTIEVTVMGIAKPSVTSGTGAWGLFTLTEELADQLYPDIENREAVWNVHTSEDSDALRASIFSLLENPVLTVFFQSRPCGIPGIAAKDDDPRCLSAAGVPVCVLHGKSGQHPDDQSAGKAAGAWDFAVCGNDRKAGFPYADCRMPVVRRGYGIFGQFGIGGILGWIFDYVISSFNIFGELSYQFPLMETVVFVLALLVVTGIFSVVAVRYSKRLSLVERIKTMD